MRFLLLALMIALLPVRGWMGNAMAVDMASQAVANAQKTATSAASPGADTSMPADCPMLAQLSANDAVSADTPQADGGRCNACDTCELCLALATTTWFYAAPAAFARHAEPLAIGHGFSSADRFSSLKPPIS
jgi:hypothetical protein